MSRITSTVASTVLFKVGNTDELKESYKKKRLCFSCPANWMDKAIRNKEHSIGDFLECAFARVRNNDPEIDRLAKQYGDNLLIMKYHDGTCFLFFVPTLLTPTLCFYVVCVTQDNSKIEINLHDFTKQMNMNCGTTSGIVILDTKAFYNDLICSIPQIVIDSTILSSDRLCKGFSANDPILISNVQYTDIYKSLFHLKKDIAIFTKQQPYSYQNEQRFIIPNVHFKHYGIIGEDYCYTNNLLSVNLPHLHEYALFVE